MLRYLADENLNRAIVIGLRQRSPDLDIVRVQDVGLRGASDSAVLEFAANEKRLVVTHDVSTMPAHVVQRLQAGETVPGLIEVRQSTASRLIIEDLLLLAECSREGEWDGQVLFLPL